MKKLKDILKEAINPTMGAVYSNPYATAFTNKNDDSAEVEFTSEQRDVFLAAVKEYKKFGESVYRTKGLEEVCKSIKNLVEVANKITIKETGDWFDGVTVSRHMKRMNESYKVFEKTLTEVATLQQRMESSYDEIGEVLSKYYEICNGEDELEEGNEFGAARTTAIANGDSEFEVDGKTYPVTDVSKDDKENAEEFKNESVVNEAKDVGHYERVGNQTIVDSNFVNYSKGVLPDSELVHLGMGDFAIKSKSGTIKFQRSGKLDGIGQDFVGRPHRMTDDKNGKLVELFLKLMLKKKKAILSMSESVVNEGMAGWIAGYNGKQIEIKKGEAKDLYNAKLLAIKKLKVPKSKVGLMFIKPAVDESVVNEAKYDIGMARKGSGLTIYNKAEEEKGDYKTIAHIDNKGNVKFLDKKLPKDVLSKIDDEANKMKESINENAFAVIEKNIWRAIQLSKYADGDDYLQKMLFGRVIDSLRGNKHIVTKISNIKTKLGKGYGDITITAKVDVVLPDSAQTGTKNFKYTQSNSKVKGIIESINEANKIKESITEHNSKGNGMIKLKGLLKESFGLGELPSSKLMKMKMTLAELMASEDTVNEGYSSEEKKIVLSAVRKLMKYKNIDIELAAQYVVGAAEELKADIDNGKVKK